MHIQVLVAEIGSTTTVVNAFSGLQSHRPLFVGQGQAPTSVAEGDVRVGLRQAIENLSAALNEPITYDQMLATSSAAGGLRMTVHGLVYDMTARAAREAALGAGGIIHQVTAGKMRPSDLKTLIQIRPNIVLLAGGVDYGERDTALYNAQLIADLDLALPVLYAGNLENHEEIRSIFENTSYTLYLTENVYPKIDQLNVEPARRVIQRVFEEHIVHAPGMEHIREMVQGPIIPTPGAVMESAKMLYERMGDLLVLDVGGATTDLHSVCPPSEEIDRISVSPEPLAKRTVEGDLGVYVNMRNILEKMDTQKLEQRLGFSLEPILRNYPPIPKTDQEKALVEALTQEAVLRAVSRHAGQIRNVYGPTGKSSLAEGKDLTPVRYIIGTGGALSRLAGKEKILRQIALQNRSGLLLYPTQAAQILIDQDYILASLGVLSKVYRLAAFRLACQSLSVNPGDFENQEDIDGLPLY